MEYKLDGGACIPIRVHTIVISVQHSEDISLEEMKAQLKEKVIHCEVKRVDNYYN